jgi:parallel beta-helix repeat protein
MALVSQARAGIIQVKDRQDSGPYTLRQALADAVNGDLISFTISGESNSITVYSPLAVDKQVIIQGDGTQTIGTLDNTVDVFMVTSDSVTIQNLAIVGGHSGVHLQNCSNFEVYLCRIGTDWSDSPVRGSAFAGIQVTNGSNIQIGASTLGNVISGNTGYGIVLETGSHQVQAVGNWIGTNAAGTAALANGTGVWITGGSSNNVIGGDRFAGKQNVISGNHTYGVSIDSTGGVSTGNYISGNIIGLSASQGATIANQNSGVLITRSPGNFVGTGVTTGYGNIIAGNGGLSIMADYSDLTAVQNNLIGLNESGVKSPLDNYGVLITNSSACWIATNFISGFSSGGRYGIQLSGMFCEGNTVNGNWIGTDLTGAAAVPNYNGLELLSESGNYVTNNAISGNAHYGISLDSADHNTILGNIIGLESNGTAALASLTGIYFSSNASSYNRIGDGTMQGRNVIVGKNYGIFSNAANHHNSIQGNFFGTTQDGSAQVQTNGSSLVDYGHDTLIGGPSVGMGNVFTNPVEIHGSGNTLASNAMGVLADLSTPAPLAVGLTFADGSNNWAGYPGGPGNLIANAVTGLEIVSGSGIALYANTICACSSAAVSLASGANNNKTAPAITGVSPTLISGQAVAGDSVEVFLAEHQAGAGGSVSRLGTATADSQGVWHLPVSLAYGDYVCAMATNQGRNTSGFSANVAITVATATPTMTVSPTMTPSPTITRTATVSPTLTASATVTVTTTRMPVAPGEVRAFPNPGRSQIHFLLNPGQASEATVTLFNLGGERVARVKSDLPAGPGELVWDCHAVAPGIYMARIKANGVEKTLKLAIIK